jgi:hypothetical protein
MAKAVGPVNENLARLLDGAAEAIGDGPADPRKVGELAVDVVGEGCKVIATVALGPNQSRDVNKGIDEVVNLIKQHAGDKLELAGRFVIASGGLARQSREVIAAADKTFLEMPPGASALDRFERKVALGGRMTEYMEQGMSLEEARERARDELRDKGFADHERFENDKAARARKAQGLPEPEIGAHDVKLDPSKLPPEQDEYQLEPLPSPVNDARREVAEANQKLAEARFLESRSHDDPAQQRGRHLDGLAEAEQRAAHANEQARALETFEKEIAVQEARLQAALQERELADIVVNDAIANGRKPRPAALWNQQQAEARVAHEEARLADLRRRGPMPPLRLGPPDQGTQNRIVVDPDDPPPNPPAGGNADVEAEREAMAADEQDPAKRRL